MLSFDVYIQYPKNNFVSDKIATFSIENDLVFKDEGEGFKAHLISSTKFSVITLTSPLIAIARLIRSFAFVVTGDINRASREFVGGFAVPFVAAGCLTGSLLSTFVYVLTFKNISFYVEMSRTYAYFEAWVNNIDLHSNKLVSYSQRVSYPIDFIGDEKSVTKRVWTTAPCMQPILEKCFSMRDGIFDIVRIRKIFPFNKINDIEIQNNKFVLHCEYPEEDIHYLTYNGGCEQARNSQTYCCYRVESAYDRILCC